MIPYTYERVYTDEWKSLADSLPIFLVQIGDLESGKAVPDQALLGKLERKLNVKLRGAKNLIGTPLHAPKKNK